MFCETNLNYAHLYSWQGQLSLQVLIKQVYRFNNYCRYSTAITLELFVV